MHFKKILSLLALTIILLPNQAQADNWEQRHDERKAIHRKMDKVERADKEKINRQKNSWRQKHKERKAEHAKIKAQEAKEKAALEDKDGSWRKRRSEHAQKHAKREAKRSNAARNAKK